jgi:glycosyltransferase involved in cell wall biosynthesis
MRVLINALSARRGGGQTYLINLLRHAPREHDLELFLLAPEALPVIDGVAPIHRIRASPWLLNPFVRVAWERVALPRLARKVRAEVLFCPGGIVGAVLSPPCRTATMFRNMIPFDAAQRRRYPWGYMRARNWLLRRAMLRSMLRADLVVFVSRYAKEVIERAAGRPLGRSVVIPHGVGDSFRMPSTGPLPRPAWIPTGPYLLYVSTLDFYKAQIEVVRGYELLRQRRETPERLVLVGSENPAYARLVRDEIGRLGLTDRVLLAGSVPYQDIPPLYQNAKMIVFASESENCPNILLESLASARPIVCSNRPPMPEFGADAVVYFDPSSPADLADKLATVIDDEAALARLSTRAAERAAGYDWAIAGRETWNALRALAVG